MSRGLSGLQRRVVDALNGVGRNSYKGAGALSTSELLEEVQGAGFLEWARTRRQATNTLRRACRSLEARGLIVCTGLGWVDGHGEELSWEAAPKPLAGEGRPGPTLPPAT